MVTPLKGSAVFIQHGEPTAVVNSSLAGAVQEASRSDCIDKLLAAYNGILGVLQEELFDLRKERADDIENLKRTPSAALGSGGDEIVSDADAERVVEVLGAHNIRYFFCAGGRSAMASADRIGRLAAGRGYELRIVGIPQTTDNDLAGTDHCPGYGSAAKCAAAAVLEAGRHAESLWPREACTVQEVAGVRSGWLAAGTGLARRSPEDAPHLIYVPERPVSLAAVARDVQACLAEFRRCFVVAAEGLRNERGEPLAASGGAAEPLRAFIEKELGVRCRANRPGTAVRAGMHFASLTDVNEAVEAGVAAVRKAVAGQSGVMIALVRETGPVYRCSTGTMRLSDVADGARPLPGNFLNAAGNGATDALREYVKPLVRGEAPLNIGPDGLPVYVRLQKRFVPKALAQWAPAPEKAIR